MKAFDHNWPFVSFTGFKDNVVFLVNAFEKEHIHRIQIVDDETCENTRFQILATKMTESHDLMIMSYSQQKGKYQIFQVDLDKANRLNRDNGGGDADYFKPEMICEYTEDKVGN